MADEAIPQGRKLHCWHCAGVRCRDQQQVAIPLPLQRVPGAWQRPQLSFSPLIEQILRLDLWSKP